MTCMKMVREKFAKKPEIADEYYDNNYYDDEDDFDDDYDFDEDEDDDDYDVNFIDLD